MAAAKDKSGPVSGEAAAPQSLESLLVQLEAVVSDLEGGETELEQSLNLYEKGMALVKLCNQRLEAVEQRIAVVTRGAGDAPVLESFEHQASHEPGSTPKAR